MINTTLKNIIIVLTLKDYKPEYDLQSFSLRNEIILRFDFFLLFGSVF